MFNKETEKNYIQVLFNFLFMIFQCLGRGVGGICDGLAVKSYYDRALLQLNWVILSNWPIEFIECKEKSGSG